LTKVSSHFFRFFGLQHRQAVFFLDGGELKVVVDFAQLFKLVLLQTDPAAQIRLAFSCAGEAMDDVRSLEFSDQNRVEHLFLADEAVVSWIILPPAS